MNKAGFSVVIPLFNKELHIERAIHSVLLQTFRFFEIIVIDDGSTDKGTEIVKNLKNPSLRLYSQTNQGVSAARNEGIKKAEYDLIAFLDADDEWKPDFLETIKRLLQKYPEAGIFATAYEIIMPNGRIQRPHLKHIPSPPWEGILPNYFRAALGEPPVWTSACVIPKRVFNAVGGFSIGIKRGEDLDMWARIALKYPVAYTRYIGAIWHKDASNRACNHNIIDEFLPFTNIAIEAILNGQIQANMAQDIEKYIAKEKIKAIKQNILSGNLSNAKRMLRQYQMSQYYLKKIFWQFWSMMPFGFTHLAHKIIKSLISLYRNRHM